MTDGTVIDWEYLESMRELQPPDRPDIVQELVQMFVTESKLRRTLLADAAQRRNAEEIRRLAHSLRGSAGQIGAVQLARVSAELEAAATVPDGDMTNLIDRVNTALRDALAALDEGDKEGAGNL